MPFLISPNKALGLDISDLSLKAVQLTKKRNNIYIQTMNSIKVPSGLIEEGTIKDKDKLSALIKKLVKGGVNGFTTRYAVVCLPEQKTFIKVIDIADREIQEHRVRDIIIRELPRHMPLSMEEVQIDWQEIGKENKKRKFLVGAVPKAVIDDYLELCQSAGLEIVALEVEAQAILRSILPKVIGAKENKNTAPSETRPKIILDLGATRTGLILVDHGIIQFTSSLSRISGEKITAKIMEDKNFSHQQAEKAKIICGVNPKKCRGAILEIIKSYINELLKEIINADNFYQTHFGQETHNIEIILCGGGAELSNIDKVLEEKLGRRVKIADPLINLKKELPKKVNSLSAYTTAIGLALRNYI